MSSSQLAQVMDAWAARAGVDSRQLPGPWGLEGWLNGRNLRHPAEPGRIAAWEQRYGASLPKSLHAWLSLSDGFYIDDAPWVHPLAAFGPMIPFARVPGMIIQPESWFELGNPDTETICIDLGYVWPGGGCPVFTSGDDERHTSPRIIAPSFTSWFVRLLREGGRPFWFDAGFESLGDPWLEHCRAVPPQRLPRRLLDLTADVRGFLAQGADERDIRAALGLSGLDLEAIFRFIQHASAIDREPARA